MTADHSKLTFDQLKNSKSFCILPWTHFSLQPGGRIQPCCHFDRKSFAGNLTDSKLKDIWNSEAFRNVRKKMLSGELPPGCWECSELDKKGTASLRVRSNWKYLAKHWEIVKKTDAEGWLPELRTASLNLRFSNKCNLRCRTCGPSNSTAWYSDAKLLGQKVPGRVLSVEFSDRSFLEQIGPYLHKLESVHITGGEPLMLDEHYEFLELLLEKGLTHIKLDYNTNMSKLVYGKYDVVKLWQKFENVSIDASLDGEGARGDYLRKNLVWSVAVANCRRIRAEAPHVSLGVHCTLSLMNALHLPDYHKNLVSEGIITIDRFVINPLMGPPIFRAQVLPPFIKALVREKYADHIENYIRPRMGLNSNQEEAYRNAIGFISAQDQSHMLPQFLKQTSALDFIRKENFFEVFPELAEIQSAWSGKDLCTRGKVQENSLASSGPASL